MFPVDDLYRLDSFVVVRCSVGDPDAIPKQFVNFLIGTDWAKDTAVFGEFI